jgi:hypothetical protein
MCSKDRMSSSEPKPNAAAANNSGGIFGAIGSVFSKAKNAVVGNKPANSNAKKNNSSNAKKNNSNVSKKNNSMNAVPAVAGVNAPVVNATPVPAANNTAVVKGGFVAPVNFRYPPNMQQPSEEVMEWATTAGAPTPTGPQMRNVAHGGKRRTHRKRSSHRRRSGGNRRNRNRSRRNKTGGSRRNRNRSRRNKTGGNRRNRNRTRRNRN